MKFKGLNQIAIGLIFLFFHFNINRFDIIPDFIGYIFILVGLSALVAHSRAFSHTKFFAAVLLASSILNVIDGFFDFDSEIFIWPINSVILIFSIGFRLSLGKGMVDLLANCNLTANIKSTTNCIAFSIFISLTFGILKFPPLSNLLTVKYILIPLTILSLIAELLLIILVFKNKKMLESKYISASDTITDDDTDVVDAGVVDAGVVDAGVVE